MSIVEQIDADLKTAMLTGDKLTADTLKLVKNALQYEAVGSGGEQTPASDELAIKVLSREAKKRTEAIEIYNKAGEADRAKAETTERQIIEKYLPPAASEDDIKLAVEQEVAKWNSPTPADMGKIIGAVRASLGATADGALIASLVKQALER